MAFSLGRSQPRGQIMMIGTARRSPHPNSISIRQPPYNARGDDTTCDDVAIQKAVYNACGFSPGQPPPQQETLHPNLLIPYSPKAYLLCQPVVVPCSLTIIGDGPWSSVLHGGYHGPDLLLQAPNPGAITNLTTAVVRVWNANTFYGQYTQVRDSNDNIEVAVTSGTSGGASPSWPATIGSHTVDGSVTWSLGPIGNSLLGGPGVAYDSVNNKNALINLNDAPTLNVNNQSALTIEFFFDAVGYNPSSGQELISSLPAHPNTSSGGAFNIYTTCWTGPSSCAVTASIKTSIDGLVQLAAPFKLDTLYHLAFVQDGKNLSLYLNGNLVASAAARGTIVQNHYENIAVGAYADTWPASNVVLESLTGFIESVRISNIARYSAPFVNPSQRFSADAATLLLLNFPDGAPFGTYEAVSNDVNKPLVYIAYPTGDVGHQLNHASISGLELCPLESWGGGDGIYATWTISSLFRNLQCTAPESYALYMAGTDYQNDFEQIYTGIKWGSVPTSLAYFFGPASNVNIYNGLKCDGNDSCIVQIGGSGLYTIPEIVDRGSDIYPFIIAGGAAVIVYPFYDFEAGNKVLVTSLFVSDSWGAGVLVLGGFLVSSNPKATLLTIDRGQPIVTQSVDFFGPADYIVNVLSAPNSPLVMQYDNFNGIPVVNSANAQYVEIVN